MYHIGSERLYVLDSLAMYPPPDLRPEQILLTQSPKINLQRLIDSLRPKMIIADGSNYRSDVLRWERTCAQNEVPFHYTGKKGAYRFDLKKIRSVHLAH
jgi:competence protein ComEC